MLLSSRMLKINKLRVFNRSFPTTLTCCCSKLASSLVYMYSSPPAPVPAIIGAAGSLYGSAVNGILEFV